MDKFLSMLFYLRDYAHKQHLLTDSYNVHMALDELYTDIVEDMDELAEIWQGKFGKLKGIPDMNVKPLNTPNKELRRIVEWIEKNRYELCDKDEAALQAIVDDIVADLYTALYKMDQFNKV